MLKSYPFSTNLLGYAAIGMMGCSILFSVLAVGLPYWERSKVTLGDLVTVTKQGLWTYCIDYEPQETPYDGTYTDTCGTYGDGGIDGTNTAGVRATRGLLLLGLVLDIASLVCAVLATFSMKTNLIVHYISFWTGIAAGLFLMISFAVFLGQTKIDGYQLDVCVSLDIIAWLQAWVASAFIIVAVKVKKDDD